ncbi:MAG: molybdopterin-binding/glycosyltransferase family 2 protein [Rhodospirillales bacterium]|nr:molybdopterin-binding/glycosyltransferase family 2 protein [Rhodospirillales bacterium]
MIFESLALAEAKGAILAHSLRLPGKMLRKGSVLGEDSIAALGEAGHASVVAARLEPGDVPEDVAADRLATALLTPLIGRSRAATGRVNLYAEVPGLLRVAAATVDRLNRLDEALTLATLPDYAVVAPKELVATIKIIPFAVADTALAVAEALARQEKAALRLHPFQPYKVGLVMTELSGIKESVVEHTIAATAARVNALTGTLLAPRRARHATDAIADALRALLTEGADILLVAGASAVVDRRDVGPEGIVQAGGHILHFGMPVDPGNLICLGAIGEKPALVLPGCARSQKLNGIDFVLSRLFAGQPVGPAEVAAMGVGGLLKEIETRPMPRAEAPATPRIGAAPRARPSVAAIVLAAGRSRRMAPQNKLLISGPSGKPIITRVVDNVLSSAARPVLVVTGHQAEDVERALAGRPVRFVHAPDYAQGLSASLKAGIGAVPPECAGAIVCLGDMPLVTGRMIDRLLGAFDPDEGRAIVLPNFRGKQGNPMLWDRRFFPEILAISGDIGARFLLAKHTEVVAEVEMADDAVLRDIDTPEALAAMPRRF